MSKYIVVVPKTIHGQYPDDEPEKFKEAIEFESEEKLKEWILKNSNLTKFTVFKAEQIIFKQHVTLE